MLFHLLTIHPPLVSGYLGESILGRARGEGIIDTRVVNIRDFALSRHQTTDDYPYGGGVGLLMKPEPIVGAMEWAVAQGVDYRRPDQADNARPPRTLLMDPQGRRLDQAFAKELAAERHLVFVCGRYEGVDQRVREVVTDLVSVGDYVLTGGELAALILVDAVARLVPGVLGDEFSAVGESFATGLLEGPQYTRPPEFQGMAVPEILLSGDHGRIARWQREQALLATWRHRPDLLATAPLSSEDRAYLRSLGPQERRP